MFNDFFLPRLSQQLQSLKVSPDIEFIVQRLINVTNTYGGMDCLHLNHRLCFRFDPQNMQIKKNQH